MNILILYFVFAALYGFITTFRERTGCDEYTEYVAASIGWSPPNAVQRNGRDPGIYPANIIGVRYLFLSQQKTLKWICHDGKWQRSLAILKEK